MINIDNFIAINDKRNGQNSFKVFGTVMVSNPAITPALSEPTFRHRGGWEVLNLDLRDEGGFAPQVLTSKSVYFERAGGTHWGTVEINHPGGTSHLKIITIE
ncbi:hypothetical protein [Pseudomonas sp. PSKL.D1]|uniref:hypothetical protein n=1 Tax=Pseudomonas sp. PSKL.D1 TaxID=3029060 RepID=UPI002380E2F8|nr:hypothetical protein [Pseudomonas sp. PSKL.D1]WDY58031.1 hypothetical protein PVV54_26305 [Pseudomonas sp. PSKL.D1]